MIPTMKASIYEMHRSRRRRRNKGQLAMVMVMAMAVAMAKAMPMAMKKKVEEKMEEIRNNWNKKEEGSKRRVKRR